MPGTHNNTTRPQRVLDSAAFSQEFRIPDDFDATLTSSQPAVNYGLKMGGGTRCNRALSDDEIIATSGAG